MSKKGLREALGAVWAGIALALVIAGIATAVAMLAGCTAYAKLSHRSSIPDNRDRNTSDTLGGCFEVKLGKGCGEWCPLMEGCVNFEFNDAPVYGKDPSGEISIRQPIYRRP